MRYGVPTITAWCDASAPPIRLPTMRAPSSSTRTPESAPRITLARTVVRGARSSVIAWSGPLTYGTSLQSIG